MTLSQLLSIFAARWRSALLVMLLAVLTAVALGMFLPQRYKSTASVMLDVRTPDPVGGVALAGMLSPAYMATQVDLIKSEQVARKAIRALGLSNNPEVQSQWQEATEGKGELEPWLADVLLRKLEVTPSRESNVIHVSYESPDARFAAALTNAIVKAYVDSTVELRADPARRYNSFFDSRARELREALEEAQSKLSAYQKSQGLLATDERLDVENHRLTELSTQLVALQALVAESGGRAAQAGQRPEQMSEVLGNPVVSTLTADIAREESRTQELVERLGANHPQLQAARSQLAELRRKREDALRSATGSLSVNNSVNQTRLAQVRAAHEAQRARVLQLKSLRDEAAVLQRDVENAQRAYDAITMRVNQTNVESQNTLSNVSIIRTASESPRPSSPNIVLIVAGTLVMGVVLSIGTAMFRELRDRRLRNADDVVVDLGCQLLAVLPSARLGTSTQSKPHKRSLARMLPGLVRQGRAA